ncbi:MAG: hypothetical protein RBU30_07115 [Polyangia bacterium]|jgi:hypothetical protein|nr:hypothetical protein [Polyangia bacterium]
MLVFFLTAIGLGVALVALSLFLPSQGEATDHLGQPPGMLAPTNSLLGFSGMTLLSSGLLARSLPALAGPSS